MNVWRSESVFVGEEPCVRSNRGVLRGILGGGDLGKGLRVSRRYLVREETMLVQDTNGDKNIMDSIN